VDLQACGGTHVANTAEIGRVQVVKIENKGTHNRRVTVALATHPSPTLSPQRPEREK
jgi:misacylated tRNA(Ala) deacylase